MRLYGFGRTHRFAPCRLFENEYYNLIKIHLLLKLIMVHEQCLPAAGANAYCSNWSYLKPVG
jgi:hypothetical protein